MSAMSSAKAIAAATYNRNLTTTSGDVTLKVPKLMNRSSKNGQ